MIIVSMTSFPGRISLVPTAWRSFIRNQTMKADKYVLWLSSDEFSGEKNPEEIGLEGLAELGVEIHWCVKNSYVHKRHHSIEMWPDAYNIFIDEDLIYPSTFVEELIDNAEAHQGAVISYFACYEVFNGRRKKALPLLPYPSTKNKFNGGLVCFPPHTFPMVSFRYSDIRDLICPYHDETWISLFLKYNGTKVFGVHPIDWSVFKPFVDERTIPNLNVKNREKKKQLFAYSLDAIQFNSVLYVFPELLRAFKDNVGRRYSPPCYWERKRLEKLYQSIRVLHIGE